MKKVKVEVQNTLTYTPFANLSQIIDDSKKGSKEREKPLTERKPKTGM